MPCVLVDDAKRLVSVLLGGDALDGNVEALNAALTAFGNKQKAGENDVTVGQNVATKFRFTPDDPIEVGASVKVVGKKGILTYNGIEMAAFESEYVLITDAASDPITALFYSGIRELDAGARLDLMTDLTVTGSAGKITFRALNPAIATVDANGVVTAVSGCPPGSVSIPRRRVPLPLHRRRCSYRPRRRSRCSSTLPAPCR